MCRLFSKFSNVSYSVSSFCLILITIINVLLQFFYRISAKQALRHPYFKQLRYSCNLNKVNYKENKLKLMKIKRHTSLGNEFVY